MNVFKPTSTKDTLKEVYFGQHILSKLYNAIKHVGSEGHQNHEELCAGESVNELCYCIEAVFLHGYKAKLTKMVSEFVSSGASSKLPKIDFWDFVMLFTSKPMLQDMKCLTLINTDIGRCRAWVRLALNEASLSSFLQSMVSDTKIMGSFYKSSALLRNTESVDIITRLFHNLSYSRFNIVTNNASLNLWNPNPLIMVGLYKPDTIEPVIRGVEVGEYFLDQESNKEVKKPVKKPKKNKKKEDNSSAKDKGGDNVSNCSSFASIDVKDVSLGSELEQALGRSLPQRDVWHAYRLPDDNNDNDNTSKPHSEAASDEVQELLTQLNLDKNQGFQPQEINDVPAILEEEIEVEVETTTNSESELIEQDSGHLRSPEGADSPASELPADHQEFQEPVSPDIDVMHCSSRSLGDATAGWSSDFDQNSMNQSHDSQSFDSLLKNYNKQLVLVEDDLPCGTPVLENMMSKHDLKKSAADSTEGSNDTSSGVPSALEGNEDEDEDFEYIAHQVDDERTKYLRSEVVFNIPHEFGLDQQNFECFACKCSIGMIFGPYKKCSLDGHLYCEECFYEDGATLLHVIPSRVLHHWDLVAYPVCKYNKKFLLKFEQEPVFDIRDLNPSLYAIVPELYTLQNMRRQLSFLKLYLFSCNQKVADELKKIIWPREHLYDHVHLYSTMDLLSIPSGTLKKPLMKAVAHACKHVTSCQLCAQKGFICELCNDSKVIFPFDLETTYYCEQCSALYHKKCMANNSNACNKCERKRIRAERERQMLMSKSIENGNVIRGDEEK